MKKFRMIVMLFRRLNRSTDWKKFRMLNLEAAKEKEIKIAASHLSRTKGSTEVQLRWALSSCLQHVCWLCLVFKVFLGKLQI